jgi:hypothetical protein
MRGVNRSWSIVLIAAGSVTVACARKHVEGDRPAGGTPRSAAMAIKITIDSGTAKHVMTTRMLALGTKSRMELTSDLVPGGHDSYMVIDSRDNTMLSVMPSAKMATIMKVPSVTYVSSVDIPKVTRSNVTRDETIDLGPGDPILGFATHHYRHVRASSTTLTYSDRVCTRNGSSASEVWVTTDPAAAAIERAANVGAFSSKMPGMRDLSRRVAASEGKIPHGVELRSIATDTSISATGAVTATRFETEFTELSSAPLDTALFTAPAEFRLMDMRGLTISGDMSKIMAQQATTLEPGCIAKPA